MTQTGAVVFNVEQDPDAGDIAFLDDRLTAFTIAMSGHDDARPLAIFVRDDDGRIVAGIHGWTWGRCCELISLWVEEERRGRGVGRALLAAAEQEAGRRQCLQVVLFTHAMQAPRLYLDTGYELVGAVDDYPAGNAAYWLRKHLES